MQSAQSSQKPQSNRELERQIGELESDTKEQDAEIADLRGHEQQLQVQINLSKLVIIELMRKMHNKVKDHLEDDQVEFSKIAPGVDLTLFETQKKGVKNSGRIQEGAIEDDDELKNTAASAAASTAAKRFQSSGQKSGRPTQLEDDAIMEEIIEEPSRDERSDSFNVRPKDGVDKNSKA